MKKIDILQRELKKAIEKDLKHTFEVKQNTQEIIEIWGKNAKEHAATLAEHSAKVIVQKFLECVDKKDLEYLSLLNVTEIKERVRKTSRAIAAEFVKNSRRHKVEPQQRVS